MNQYMAFQLTAHLGPIHALLVVHFHQVLMDCSVSSQQDSTLPAGKCLAALTVGQNVHRLQNIRATDGLFGKSPMACSHLKSEVKQGKCSAGGAVR